MRNGIVISQAPGSITYSNQMNPPQHGNPKIVNRWNPPPQQSYNNLQTYPSFESNNSGINTHNNNLPPAYQNQGYNQMNTQVPATNNGFNNTNGDIPHKF